MVNPKTYAKVKAVGGEPYEEIKQLNKRQAYGRRHRVSWQMIQYDRKAGPPKPAWKRLNTELHKTCPWCQKTFITKLSRQICCSASCKDSRKQGVLHRYPPKPKHRTKDKPCRVCGQLIGPRRRTYCSETCSAHGRIENSADRVHRFRLPAKRAGDRGITITRLLKRDGPRCYICKRITTKKKRTAQGKRPKLMATIDHVVPIAAGGGHTWDNVRVACWKCNAKKSAQILEAYEPTLFEVS